MNDFDLSFDHLGLAVRDPVKACDFLKGLGYKIGTEIFDPEQNICLILCVSQTMPTVEVIFSPKNDKPCPIEKIISTNSEMIYHQCYSCVSTSESIKKITNAGFRAICVSPPKPAVLFNGDLVSFYIIKGFGLIEIRERKI